MLNGTIAQSTKAGCCGRQLLGQGQIGSGRLLLPIIALSVAGDVIIIVFNGI